MFVINKVDNTIQALQKRTFSELGFKERAHLQEWIAKNPECLGEKLLIIQKEFDGFSDTYERLDLLAIDKDGNLVIIENKLDDSGRDVTWQALKYASYCSTLTKEDIRNIYQEYLEAQGANQSAIEKIEEFFDGQEYGDIVFNKRMTQRVLLVAANFRKEVTSTVLWLMNFKIQLQCFKATPYQLNDDYFLTLDQIIPTKDAQDYVISMTNKAQEEVATGAEIKSRHKIRLKFWAEFLKAIKAKSTLFQNSNPTKDHWLVAGGTDITYVSYQVVVTANNASVFLNFGRPSADENKMLFDELKKSQTQIEEEFGGQLIWDRMDSYKSSKVGLTVPGMNYFNEEEWPQIINFLIVNLNKLDKSIKTLLPSIKKTLSTTSIDQSEIAIDSNSLIV